MGQNRRNLRKLCWRVFVLLVLAGVFLLAPPPPATHADACMDAYSVCVSNCYDNPSCLYTCVHDAQTNGCFVTGDQWACDTAFNGCRNIGNHGAGTEESDCFDIYATCQYNAASGARSHFMMLQSVDLEPDDPCLVAARDDYFSCLDGNNNMCLSQVDSSMIMGCCQGEYQKARAACYGNFGS